jgi:hypothetical protein
MTAVSDDDEVRARQRENIRARIAFYGSTPGYGIVFDASGWPGVGERLNELQRAGDVPAMTRLITDDIVDAVSITSTWEELPQQLLDRFAGRAADITCYSALEHWRDEDDPVGRWQDVTSQFAALTAASSSARGG